MLEKSNVLKKYLAIALFLAFPGCAARTIPLVNITGSGEHPWVWPYFMDGQPTVLAFWTTDEMQCLRDVPALKTLDARQGSVQLVTVVAGRDRLEIGKWLRRERIDYPVLLDLEGELSRHLGVYEYPAYLFFDTRGKEVDRVGDVRVVHNWFDRPRWLARSGAYDEDGAVASE